MNQKRQPKGTQTGGQFAPDVHSESTLVLDDFEITTFEHHGLPAASFSHVVHIGSFDPNAKKSYSLEGDGLSVSTEPEAWEEIASLGGHKWWTLTKNNNVFLDAHSLTKENESAINDWGVERGYLVEVDDWRIEYYDDEMEGTMFSSFDTEKEAREELEDWGDDAQEPTHHFRFDAGPNFPDAAGRMNADQVILCVWAEEMSDFDGVWWNENLDPGRLSAPRAVILKSRLPQWDAA